MKFLAIISTNIQEEITLKFRGILPQTPDEKLEEKVIGVFGAMNIIITKNNVVDCHRLSKSSKSKIVPFMNRKHCYVILRKNLKLQKLINQNLVLSQMLNFM